MTRDIIDGVPQNLDKVEVRNLIAITKQRTRAARAEVIARAGAMLAEFERSMQDELGPQDEALGALHSEAEEHLAKINSLLRAKCQTIGVPTQWAPVFTVTFPAKDGTLITKRRAEMRKVATSRLAALKTNALLEIERSESTLLTELITTQLLAKPAAEWLAQLPTAQALMPDVTFAAVASISAAELVPGMSTDA